ncbi:MAG: OmpA family protein [Parapedobacter sp.]|nr:MAG: OmpA family protein [Parapedobacter sp.]
MNYKTIVFAVFVAVGSISSVNGQILKKLAKKAEKAAERTVERRVEREAEKKTDEALDKVFEGGDKDKKGKKDNEGSSADPTQGRVAGRDAEAAGTAASEGTAAKTFASYGKYDFVQGEKVIAVEDFSQDAVGDFPAKWNTNASGEVKTIEGSDNRWLALTTKGSVTPEFINSLPENFTLEFDLAVTPEFSFYNQPLMISMAQLTGANNFSAWSRFGRGKANGVIVWLHPQDAGNRPLGQSGYELWTDGKKAMDNKLSSVAAFNAADKNVVKVAMWRQNRRLRVYVDETKLWDLPRAFADGVKYNGVVFSRDGAKDGEEFYISNIRLAVGAPDTRSKLITEGKFSTTGIYFNSGSSVIKPESYGVLKEIATVLNENPDVKVAIIGHTDSDGSDNLNLKLSKDRAAAVKAALASEFGIEGSRMETDGKGESEPVGDNGTAEGKAQNRRVEFIKR